MCGRCLWGMSSLPSRATLFIHLPDSSASWAARARQVRLLEDPPSFQVWQHFWKGSATFPRKALSPRLQLGALRAGALPVPDITLLCPAAMQGSAAPTLEHWKNELRSSFALGERYHMNIPANLRKSEYTSFVCFKPCARLSWLSHFYCEAGIWVD